MCGINGIIYFNNNSRDKPYNFFESNISEMNSAVAHRGPDGEGIFVNYPVCFGHRRLSIIDLSDDASQPMFNEDKSVVIIFNGEIYNYKELIPELKSRGCNFKTKSDTEVILKSYETFGTDCVKKFNGMWAFAIFDFRKNIFFASRDRFGVKPFYYYSGDDSFIFSSEIKSILKIKNIKEANHGKVYDYLAYGYKTNNGDTFFKDIKELKPSDNLIIQNGKFTFEKYWNIDDIKITDINNPGQISDTIRELISDSVKIRYRSDVPVSILLSGGLDSGIITKITDELIEKNELNSGTVTAYSAVYPGYIYDESKMINKLLGTCKNIESVFLTPGENILAESFEDFIYGMGEPVFSSTSFAHYSLMKEVRKNNVKVVLNGQGADEAWCGYGRYIVGYFLLDLLFTEPGKFLSEMNSVSGVMKLSYKFILMQTLKSVFSRRYVSYLRSRYQEKIFGALNPEFRNSNFTYFRNPDNSVFSGNNLTDYLKYNIDYQGFNQILHYEDHSAMQNSVEVRSPFIDYRIIETAFSLPSKIKFNNGITKKILREVFKNDLPGYIINNHNKIGFMTPFSEWMKNERFGMFISEMINDSSFRNKTIWDTVKLKKAFDKRDLLPGFPFWRIINLELWSKVYSINNL